MFQKNMINKSCLPSIKRDTIVCNKIKFEHFQTSQIYLMQQCKESWRLMLPQWILWLLSVDQLPIFLAKLLLRHYLDNTELFFR